VETLVDGITLFVVGEVDFEGSEDGLGKLAEGAELVLDRAVSVADTNELCDVVGEVGVT